MNKVPSCRVVGSCLVLTSLLTVVLTLAVRSHGSSAYVSTKSLVVSSSGHKLTTLFDESDRDPRYSSKAIHAIRRTLRACGKKQEQPSVLERLSSNTVVQHIFGSSVVYAGCLRSQCGGDGWITMNTTCNTGAGCSGTQHFVTTEPGSDLGEFQDTSHCGLSGACGCNNFTC
jgi:hypothetical protein